VPRNQHIKGVHGGDEDGLLGCVLPKPLTGKRGGGALVPYNNSII